MIRSASLLFPDFHRLKGRPLPLSFICTETLVKSNTILREEECARFGYPAVNLIPLLNHQNEGIYFLHKVKNSLFIHFTFTVVHFYPSKRHEL